MRHEDDMIRRAVTLQMVHFGDRYDNHVEELGFANVSEDSSGGSTLIHVDNLCIPVLPEGQAEPIFSGLRLPEFWLKENMEIGEQVICWQQPTMSDKFRACRWAPAWLWDDAALSHVVTRQVGSRRPVEIAHFRGVLDLSAQWGTATWQNGVIGVWGNTLYCIEQLVTDHGNATHLLGLEDDPRLQRNELPTNYRDMRILPE